MFFFKKVLQFPTLFAQDTTKGFRAVSGESIAALVNIMATMQNLAPGNLAVADAIDNTATVLGMIMEASKLTKDK